MGKRIGIAVALLSALAIGRLLSGGTSVAAPARSGLASATDPQRPPFDVAAVIERVRWGFRPRDGVVGEYEASHAAYAVRLASDGSFEMAPRAGAPVVFATDRADRTPSIDVGPDGEAVLTDGDVVERLRNGRDGLEQSWSWSRPPATDGDLVVRVRARGLDYSGSTEQGLHFVDRLSGRGVRYGLARWIDAAGVGTSVGATWEAGEIALRVPRDVLDRSTYPAVLDPVIGPEIGTDSPVLTAAGGTGAQVVFDGTNWFFVWADQRAGYGGATQILGAHVTPAGSVLEPFGIPIATSATTLLLTPQVGFDGANYLVTWDDLDSATSMTDLVGVRVNNAGAVLDATPLVFATGVGTERAGAVQIASNGSGWLVVYMLDTNSHTGIVAKTVTSGGLVGPQIDIAPGAAAFAGYPHVAWGNGKYLVVYTESSGGVNALRGACVSAAGSLCSGALDLAPGAIVGGDYRSGPAVAFDGTNFMVVWNDVRTGSSNRNLYGTLVASDTLFPLFSSGTSLVSNVDYAADPAIAFGSTGYMVAYGVPVPGNVTAILYTVRIGTLATVDSSPINMNQTPEYEGGMAIAYDGSASFLVTGGTGLASRVSKSGTLLDLTPIAVDSTANKQTYPTATFDGTDYFVAWKDTRGGSTSVYGTRITTAGVVRDPGGIPVCTLAAARPDQPIAASNGAGAVLVVWVDYRNQTGPITGHYSIYGSLVVNGAAGANVAISDSPTDGVYRNEPTVAFDGTNFMVANSVALNHSPYTNGIEAARVNQAGALVDTFSVFSTDVSNTYFSPSLAFDGTNYLLAYTYAPTPDTSRVYVTRITTAKQVLDPAGIRVSPLFAFAFAPRVTFDGTQHVVAWTDMRNDPGDFSNGDVYAARVTPAGTVLDATSLAIATSNVWEYPLAAQRLGVKTYLEWFARAGTVMDLYGASIDAAGTVEPAGGDVLQAGIANGGSLARASATQMLATYDRYDPAQPFQSVRVRSRILSVTTTSTTTTAPSSSSTTATSSTSTSSGPQSTGSTTSSTSSPGGSSSTASTPSVTTTTVPLCGNGQLDAGEDCDPGMPGVSPLCCIGCLRQGVGTPCRLTLQGPCDLADVCDENAACAARVRGPEFSCRDPFAADNCDGGDFCDGSDPRCPTTGLGAECPISVTTKGTHVVVECQAQSLANVGKGQSECGADGIAGTSAGLETEAGADSELVVMNLVRKLIKFRRAATTGRRLLKLKLNGAGRRFLKSNPSAPVRVRITLRHGNTTRLLQVAKVLKKK